MTLGTCRRAVSLSVAAVAVATSLLAVRGPKVDDVLSPTQEIWTVKAAFLVNFAKFAEWPMLPSGSAIAMCVVGDDRIGAALTETARGQMIGGHQIDVRRPVNSTEWTACHLLFVGDGEARRSALGLNQIRGAPVLTVGDGKGFADGAGIIEFYIDDGRMRFAINVDAADRSGLRLSSQLLGLARIIRDTHVQ